jgi:uncharacterized integral membrane protein
VTDEPTDTAAPARAPLESRGERARRLAHRTKLYTWAILALAATVLLVLLVIANTRSVKVDWLLGSTHASLVLVILVAAILGWLLGVATGILFRMRTRRPRQ